MLVLLHLLQLLLLLLQLVVVLLVIVPSINSTQFNFILATQLQNKFSDALKSKRQITEADTFEPGDLPGSCCKSNNGATGLIHCNLNSTSATFYTKGCVDGFGDYLKDHAVTLGGVGIAIAFIQVLTFFLNVILIFFFSFLG